jgi:hypothetical protein
MARYRIYRKLHLEGGAGAGKGGGGGEVNE